jgi:K+-sensing histidine kinase KdpD
MMNADARKSVLAYGVAVAAVAGAVLLRWLLDPALGEHFPFHTLYGAVAIAVWYGGYRPGLLAAALGYLAANYVFVEPRGAVKFERGKDVIGCVLYLGSACIIVGFGEAMRTTRRRAEAGWRNLLDKQEQLEQEAGARRQAEGELRAAKADAERRAKEAEGAKAILQTIFDHVPEGIVLVGGPPDYPILANARYG